MKDKASYHKTALICYSIIVFLLLVVFLPICRKNPSLFDNSPLWIVWLLRVVFFLILILYMWIGARGFSELGPNEVGLILQFGKPMCQVESGFIWLPAPNIWSLQRETKLDIEEQFPENEKHTNSPTPPILITHGASKTLSNDPLDNRLTTTVSIVCRYKIVDLKAFVSTIGNKDQLRRQIKDIVITTTQVECAKDTVGKNLNRIPEINSKLKLAVTDLTQTWGIEVITVLLQNIDLGGSINEALRNVPISQINIEINKNNAQKIFYDGLAQAEVHKAFQYAKAEGYKIIAEKLNIPEPVVIFQIDTLANIWRNNNADLNLFGGGMSDVFKMITSFAKLGNDNKPS